MRIPQLVKHPTEKPGAVVSRVRVDGAARYFSPTVSLQCRLSYGVRAAPRVQSYASTSGRTLKIPNTGSHTIVWTQENTLHTFIGMGSAALTALNCALPR